MKRIPLLHNAIKDSNFSKKIKIYFATKTAGEDFDQYEKNYTKTNLNPITIKGLVTYISPDKSVYKKYGTTQQSFVEVVTEEKYASYFTQANKIEIEGVQYCTFNDKTGSKSAIQTRRNGIVRVILESV